MRCRPTAGLRVPFACSGAVSALIRIGSLAPACPALHEIAMQDTALGATFPVVPRLSFGATTFGQGALVPGWMQGMGANPQTMAALAGAHREAG